MINKEQNKVHGHGVLREYWTRCMVNTGDGKSIIGFAKRREKLRALRAKEQPAYPYTTNKHFRIFGSWH